MGTLLKTAMAIRSFLRQLRDLLPQGQLARRAILTLAPLTFLPLMLMGAAAYLRTSDMLRSQVLTQTETLVTLQVNAAQEAIKIKQIRLDRLMRQSAFASTLQELLKTTPGEPDFIVMRNRLIALFDQANREQDPPLFQRLFVADRAGPILVASEPGLEGMSLATSPAFDLLRQSDRQTFAVYDSPFYPERLSLITVVQITDPDGTPIAILGGVSDETTAVSMLKSLVMLMPASRPYLVLESGDFIQLDLYTGQMRPFTPAMRQQAIVFNAVQSMRTVSRQDRPQALSYVNEKGFPSLAQTLWSETLHSAIVLEVPIEAVFGQLNTLIPFTVGLLLVSSLVMVTVIVAGTNRVVKPILALASITSQFAQGNLQERAHVQSKDEIGLLATSFNRMADQLSAMYRSLQEQVAERTRQIRTAAEVAQTLTTFFDLDELLNKTVQLIVERFDFYHAGIFLIDPSGRYAILRAAHGPSAAEMLRRGHRLEVGSDSIVGWAAAHLKPRVAAEVDKDPLHRLNPLLPATRAEAGFPIALGEVVLGVLDVQSTEPHVFDEEMVIVLQTLANQIAVAIQQASLSGQARLDTAETERLQQRLPEIVLAETEEEAIRAAGNAMGEVNQPSILLHLHDERAKIVALHHPPRPLPVWPGPPKIDPAEVTRLLRTPLLINDLSHTETLPAEWIAPLREIGCRSGAFLPVFVQEQPVAILMIGEQPGQALTGRTAWPYLNITTVLAATLSRLRAMHSLQHRLQELEALIAFNRALYNSTDIAAFCAALHQQIKRILGDYSFAVALFDEQTHSISIPYLYEEGKTQTIEPFPLGEGLTSVLIRTCQPLLLVRDTERRAVELGAKIHGKPARSWMGVPLLVNDRPIGALIVQDLERENQFTERDLHFLNELGRQMAGAIQSLRLLEQSRRSALQLQTAAEIARDISGSLNLDELLLRAVNLIRERFNFYHAAVFLLDMHGEFAVIREATGEAGAEMKRRGHKLRVGSKSIVGYVTGRGETLVVNDTLKDATYYPNPLLPETRAEAAIPLKVGERILGALDVQSTQPFAFDEDSIRTLEILADQLAVAVINTELFAETQEHLAEHRLLHHITTSAASGATLEDALNAAVKGLQVTLGGDRVTILLLDAERKNLEVRAMAGYSEEIYNLRIPLGSGITGWVAAHRRPLRVDDVSKDPRYIHFSENTRSELAIPLIYRNELLGVLNVESEQVAAYSENDEELLSTLAGSLAAIIANARLLAQIRQQAERERLLYEVTARIRRSSDIQSILATAASELTRSLGARHVEIKIDIPPTEGSREDTLSWTG